MNILERLDLLAPIIEASCLDADLGSTGCEFVKAEILDGILYVAIDFDCDTTDFDEHHRKLIDDLLVICRRGMNGWAIVVARSCPKYFGDTE